MYPYMNTGGFPPQNPQQFGQRYAAEMQQYPAYAARPQQPQPQNTQWIPVNGIDGAKAHMVQPNVTAWLMDNNEPFFYVKSADALGVTSLKAFRFEEVQIDSEKTQDFISRNEFNAFAAEIKEILKEGLHGESIDEYDGGR